jgi:transketolase
MGKKRIIQKTDSSGDVMSSAVKLGLPKKKLLEGEVHIQSTYNNTLITITDISGNVMCAAIITPVFAAQDHNIYGGLGSAVAEVIAKKGLKVKFDIIGIKDRFAESDSQKVLFKKYGLDAEAIAATVRKMVSEK